MHWTYTAFTDDDDLQQGDIIEPSGELRNLFLEVHPHFRDPKYLAFIILSQSCDLVRRNAPCKTKYVSLAVVRSAPAVISAVLQDVAVEGLPNIFLVRDKTNAINLAKRILNQNEQSLGLFYLHPDADAGIAEPAVAMLRVSIAVRSQHYDLLAKARRGRLRSDFQMKLGWLAGNLYSRVATDDWPENETSDLVRQLLGDDEQDPSRQPQWLDERLLKEIKRQFPGALKTRESLLEASKTVVLPSSRSIVVDTVKTILGDVAPEIGPDRIKNVLTRLKNDARLTAVLKS